MQTSETINELAAALAKAQGEITGALKDSSNPFFKSKYADLASCWDACRSALSKNGLAVTQFPMTTEQHHTYLVTSLLHTSGQWMRSSLEVTPKDDSPQAMGSALTYARRYALTAVVGVAQVDDDGNAASGRSNGEIHSPKGDMGKQIHPDQAFATAAAMRDLLEADYQEDVRCIKIADKHDILNRDPDLYVAAADQLKAAERKAWKDYVAMAKKREAAEPIGRKF
jgi:hypothetical protein